MIFQQIREINEPYQDRERCLIYSEVLNFISFGVRGHHVIFRTALGSCLCTALVSAGTDNVVINFQYVRDSDKEKICFWFNKSSCESLSNRMRERKDLRADFDSIFRTWKGGV